MNNIREEVNRLHNHTKSIIDLWELERCDGDIFHEVNNILKQLLENALNSDDFLIDYHNWLTQKTSTIKLREICSSVGFEYLGGGLLIRNAINTLDSSRLWWYHKQKEIIERKLELSN